VLKRSLQVIWPAFLMAGVTEMLVFAVVDPHELRWFGGVAFGWPLSAVYTVSFLIFWLLISTASAISMLLMVEPKRDGERSDPAGLAPWTRP